MTSYSITDARGILGDLVRRAAFKHERITLTDHGRPAAIVISAADLEDLEDNLAIAEYRARAAAGDTSGQLSIDAARTRLRLPRTHRADNQQADAPDDAPGTA